MTAAVAGTLMTAEEFLALPDDGVERWLIDGEVRTWGRPEGDDVTLRNADHSTVLMRIGQLLNNWLDGRPEPRGRVAGGEAGFVLRRGPDVLAGLDAAYVGPEVPAARRGRTTLFDGPPRLAVEILSPSNTIADITDKVATYLACGVPVVWLVNPYSRMVEVHRPGASPRGLYDDATLTGDPELPGFRAAVADFFR
jgi:Uma2 family endonuclease